MLAPHSVVDYLSISRRTPSSRDHVSVSSIEPCGIPDSSLACLSLVLHICIGHATSFFSTSCPFLRLFEHEVHSSYDILLNLHAYEVTSLHLISFHFATTCFCLSYAFIYQTTWGCHG